MLNGTSTRLLNVWLSDRSQSATPIVCGCTILFVLDQVISGPRRMSSRPQEDVDPGLSVKKAEVPLPRLRGARPSTGLGSATSPHCHWPATSPPPLGESCTHRPCHPHPKCPLLKGPDDPDCSANINNATVLRVAVRGSKRALGTKPTVLHFPKYTSHHWL